MSNNATPERPIPHSLAYPIERRWSDIEKHLHRSLTGMTEPRCGHLAQTYGGGWITKSDILERWHKMNELGGNAK